ncbi:MAG: hypothetical protein P4N24_17090 [Acidobacteriota bacterium]|nr:hypothetical protein [Acidobacteriota bacterium]
MSLAVKKTSLIPAVLLLALVAPAYAQVTKGETSLNLNGTISAGYTDDYTNLGSSDHSIVGAGTADLSGSYFNPNFLTFDIQPFYNQSRVNSNFQSLTASSGVNASAKLFGGGEFPGSISYSRSFNSSGTFNIPGLTNFTTHGDSDVLTLTWGAHPENLPSLNIGFSNANNSYTVYGAGSRGTLHSNTFSLTSAYKVAGFNLNGGYQYTGYRTLTPEFLVNVPSQHTDSSANAFSFGVGHNLPWNGGFSAAATHLDISTDFGDTTSSNRFNTTIDTLTSTVNIAPRPHLSVGANTFYTDNLEGTLYNTLLTAGVTVPQNGGQQSSHDLSVTGYANYELPEQHLNLHAYAERQQQTFLGISFASDSYNAMASYSNTLLGGSFNGVLGVTRTSLDTSQQSLMGLNASVNYSHQIHRWVVAGGFSYSQAVQTILINYTTSGYNYNGSVGRRIRRRSYWGAYVSGARSLLTDLPGSANSSQSYATSLTVSRFSFNGSYTDSSGNALLTTTGLVSNPVPLPAVNPAAVVFFNGKSYSAGFGANPVRGLTMSASYSKALSGTQSASLSSNNNNENINVLMTYNFRKLNFITGYSRLVQGFSVSGAPPAMVGSFFVGVSRWFNFF